MNGERIASTSAIIDIGGSILVNAAYLSPPYQISAIGPPDLFDQVNGSAGFRDFVRMRVEVVRAPGRLRRARRTSRSRPTPGRSTCATPGPPAPSASPGPVGGRCASARNQLTIAAVMLHPRAPRGHPAPVAVARVRARGAVRPGAHPARGEPQHPERPAPGRDRDHRSASWPTSQGAQARGESSVDQLRLRPRPGPGLDRARRGERVRASGSPSRGPIGGAGRRGPAQRAPERRRGGAGRRRRPGRRRHGRRRRRPVRCRSRTRRSATRSRSPRSATRPTLTGSLTRVGRDRRPARGDLPRRPDHGRPGRRHGDPGARPGTSSRRTARRGSDTLPADDHRPSRAVADRSSGPTRRG